MTFRCRCIVRCQKSARLLQLVHSIRKAQSSLPTGSLQSAVAMKQFCASWPFAARVRRQLLAAKPAASELAALALQTARAIARQNVSAAHELRNYNYTQTAALVYFDLVTTQARLWLACGPKPAARAHQAKWGVARESKIHCASLPWLARRRRPATMRALFVLFKVPPPSASVSERVRACVCLCVPFPSAAS